MGAMKEPRKYPVLSPFVLILLTIGLPACSGTPEGMVVMDGVLHVMNTTVPLEPDLPVSLELQAVIGSADGPEEYQFGDIMSIEVDDEGRIFVIEWHEERILVFHADGSFSHSIGRQGQGPGELMRLQNEGLRLGPAGDLWVADEGRVQFSIFSRSGDHLRDIRTGRRLPIYFEPLGEGFIGVMERYVPTGSDVEILYEHYLNRFSAEGDSLSSMVSSSIPVNPYRMDTRSLARGVPWIVLDDRERIWQTFQRHDEYQISVFNLEGVVDRVVRKEFEPIRKSESELDEERQMYQRMMDRLERETGGLPPDFQFPEIDPLKPTIESIYHDPHGYIWAQVNVTGSDALNIFDIFDLEGLFVTRFVFTDHEQIDRLKFGRDLLCVQSTDDAGVPQIHVYRIDIPECD